MIDNEFIEWLVSYAEGFKMFDGDVKWSEYSYISPSRIVSDNILYPLLLQRAIEGINKSNIIEHSIEQGIKGICVYLKNDSYGWLDKNFFFTNFKSIDKTKEEALFFIYANTK